jgi:hypothetical protein
MVATGALTFAILDVVELPLHIISINGLKNRGFR